MYSKLWFEIISYYCCDNLYFENLQKKDILFFSLLWLLLVWKTQIWLYFFKGLTFINDKWNWFHTRNALVARGVDQIATFHEQHHFQHWNPALNAALLKSSDVPTRAIKTRYIKKLYQKLVKTLFYE